MFQVISGICPEIKKIETEEIRDEKEKENEVTILFCHIVQLYRKLHFI